MSANGKLLPNPLLASEIVAKCVLRETSPINILIDQQLIAISINKLQITWLVKEISIKIYLRSNSSLLKIS